ncbi:hypothetical protein Pla110_01670 [Polystyrenella longa]|uniref:Peptidase family M50 n=1 Tax=Polystyrenella longa TaxID=2528007 RepID=A0A518CGW3_9PLAN|nr:hypothetical protein [Polystyrenella longa]QDU78463.1 hypothetical protein Pla110_01670 [Polystyrenella longa]
MNRPAHANTSSPGRDRFLLIVSLMLLSWLSMMIVHELGHILLAFGTGGNVVEVVLHPLTISRTDVRPNPSPLWVVWGGPLVGVLLPVLGWQISQWLIPTVAYLWRFFAGFCLISNGTYLGLAPLEAVGDTRELLRLGTPLWLLVLFGIVCTVSGFLLWNGQGSEFGLGKSPRPVNRRHIWGVVTLTVIVIVAETVLSARS